MKKPASILFIFVLALGLVAADQNHVSADGLFQPGQFQPGLSQPIIASGPYRAHLRSLPITARPNRPFHVYGNSVRRIHKWIHSGRPDAAYYNAFQLPLQHALPHHSTKYCGW